MVHPDQVHVKEKTHMARKKKASWRAKRMGKICKFGFRKKSAKCLKHPRKSKR